MKVNVDSLSLLQALWDPLDQLNPADSQHTVKLMWHPYTLQHRMFVTIFSEHIFILSLKHIHIFTHTRTHTHKQAALAGIKKCVSGAVSYSRSWKTRQASLSRKTDLPLLSFAALGNRHNKNKTVLSSSCIFLPRCLDTQRQSQSTFNQ